MCRTQTPQTSPPPKKYSATHVSVMPVKAMTGHVMGLARPFTTPPGPTCGGYTRYFQNVAWTKAAYQCPLLSLLLFPQRASNCLLCCHCCVKLDAPLMGAGDAVRQQPGTAKPSKAAKKREMGVHADSHGQRYAALCRLSWAASQGKLAHGDKDYTGREQARMHRTANCSSSHRQLQQGQKREQRE